MSSPVKLKKIPLNLVEVPETRVTAVYDEETQKLLKESLAAAGTLNPIIVVAAGEKFLIVDGLHRLQEARERGETAMDAVIYEGEAKDALLMNLVLNKVRGKTKASEMVSVLGSLAQDYLLSIEDIEAKTGLSRDYIEKLLKISQASQSVQEALDQEIIGVGIAYELSRLPYAIQQDEVIAKHQIYRYQVKEVKELVDATLEEMRKLKEETPGEAPPVPVVTRKYICEGCQQEVQPRYLRPVMVCPDCFGQLWRLARAAAAQETKNDDKGGGV